MTAVPTPASLAPCSPPSRPLRAALGGGLRPVLTAAARAALRNSGRDGETVPRSNRETSLISQPNPTAATGHRGGAIEQARTPIMACEQRGSMLASSLDPRGRRNDPSADRQTHPMLAAHIYGHQQTGYMTVQAKFVLAAGERSIHDRTSGIFHALRPGSVASVGVRSAAVAGGGSRSRGSGS
jgi:hypothetical protein